MCYTVLFVYYGSVVYREPDYAGAGLGSCCSRGPQNSGAGGSRPRVVGRASAVRNALHRYVRKVSLRNRRRFLLRESGNPSRCGRISSVRGLSGWTRRAGPRGLLVW